VDVGPSGYRAMWAGLAAVSLERDFIAVSGPQAVEYLQGQLSQDVSDLAPGRSALTLLLEPQGRLVAFARVSRLDEDRLVIDTDPGAGEGALERLRRFKLRTKVDIEAVEGWRCLALRGPGLSGWSPTSAGVGTELAAEFAWPALAGLDLLGPVPQLPPEATPCPAQDWEAARIEIGLPRMGSDLDARTIPEEAGLVAATVSFTKGCYTGQELVARIDARGANVPRRLRGVVADSEVPLGAELVVDEQTVGSVTSSAVSPELGPVALAYLKRGFEVPLSCTLRWPEGSCRGTVRALPLRSAQR